MAMHNNGLTKLMEECGELIQICAKKAAYPDIDIHPDGESMKYRMSNEIGDVVASLSFVIHKLQLDAAYIDIRSKIKLQLYEQWDKEV